MIFTKAAGGGWWAGLIIKGDISVASDFPTTWLVKTWRVYKIIADVIDNDPTKTNTWLSFLNWDIIYWSGSTWLDITWLEVWIDDWTKVQTLNTRDVDINFQDILNIDKLNFNTTPSVDDLTSWQARRNPTDWTLDLGMSWGITQQIWQELFIKVINKTWSQINNWSPVYISGRQWNRPKISLAKGDSETTSWVIWITTQDILDNTEWYVTTFGYVRQIKTNYSWTGNRWTTRAEWDPLFVSKTIDWQLTNIEPTAPHHSDVVWHVWIVWWAWLGSIKVLIEKHKTLQELSDMNWTPLTTTWQIPVRNQTNWYFDFTYQVWWFFSLSWDTTLTNTHYNWTIKTTWTITITLPTAVWITWTKISFIKSDDYNQTLTLLTTSSQTVNSDTTTYINPQYTSFTVVSDWSNRLVL